MKQIWRWAWIGLMAGMTGCGGRPAGEPVTVASLAERLADPLWLARLDQEDTRIHTSYDRTGKNEDYGFFLRDGSEPGWKVIADLKGPGFVTRVWFTGAKDGWPHGFRFYFDGETEPRLAGDIKELFGGAMTPFLAPLAEYNNYCWYAFVPMPYAKSLRIECEQGPPDANGAPRKVYYQVSESRLPRGTPVETFAWPLPERDAAALEQARRIWSANRLPEAGVMQEIKLTDWRQGVRFDGPAIIHRIEFEPDWSAIPANLRDAALRDWMVSIRYDDSPHDSVQTPLGDLCGMPWRRVRARSLYFGMEDAHLFCAFPMPFAKSAVLKLASTRIPPTPMTLRVWRQPLEAPPAGNLGYFHANWRRTTPREVGRPHSIMQVRGRGKFVGCLLAVTGLDGSYWVLEGDESIRKDRETTPGWLGTGLEDYFNGGWYYQNVMAGPTHGLPVKEPFRTVQYRVHSMDPSCFEQSLDMEFERGPDHDSKAYFESVGWAYFDAPQAADSMRLRAEDRAAPMDPRLDPAIIMNAVWNHERLGDLEGARDELARRLQRYGRDYQAPVRRMLEFRLALYNERLGGPSPLPGFLADGDEQVRAAAEMIRHQREEGRTLAVLYANMPARLFIDGREVLQAGNPQRLERTLLDLPPGRHVLTIQTGRQQYPDWVLLALSGRDWFAGTDTSWKTAFDPPGDWAAPDYDDSAWPIVGGTGVKGPPEEPYIWVEPEPFIETLSRATGIRAGREWPRQARQVVYRQHIPVPGP